MSSDAFTVEAGCAIKKKNEVEFLHFRWQNFIHKQISEGNLCSIVTQNIYIHSWPKVTQQSKLIGFMVVNW